MKDYLKNIDLFKHTYKEKPIEIEGLAKNLFDVFKIKKDCYSIMITIKEEPDIRALEYFHYFAISNYSVGVSVSTNFDHLIDLYKIRRSVLLQES